MGPMGDTAGFGSRWNQDTLVAFSFLHWSIAPAKVDVELVGGYQWAKDGGAGTAPGVASLFVACFCIFVEHMSWNSRQPTGFLCIPLCSSTKVMDMFKERTKEPAKVEDGHGGGIVNFQKKQFQAYRGTLNGQFQNQTQL